MSIAITPSRRPEIEYPDSDGQPMAENTLQFRKFRFYEQYGVEEYYIYNPDNGDLSGWLRGSAGLEEVEV